MSTAKAEHGMSELRIVCATALDAEALAAGIGDALEAVAGDLPGARYAARPLAISGRVVRISKRRAAYLAALDAIAVALDLDPTLPTVEGLPS